MTTETIGGCIRFTESGPQWHTNETHAAVGFDTSAPPEINANGELVVHMLDEAPVVAAIASTDETLAGQGIQAGISGGVSFCRARFHKAGYGRLYLNNAGDYAQVEGDYANLWIAVVRVAAEAA